MTGSIVLNNYKLIITVRCIYDFLPVVAFYTGISKCASTLSLCE